MSDIENSLTTKYECENDLWLNRNGTLPGYHVLCITNDPNDSTQTKKF